MAIYLKIAGIQGSVTTVGYEGCIDVSNYTVNASRAMTQKSATAGDRTVGTLNFSSVILNKMLDAATVGLLQYFYKAKVIPELSFCHVTTGATPQCYLTNTLSNVMIGRYSEINGSRDTLEEIEMYFTAHQKTVTTMDSTHKPMAPQVAGFDTTKATSM